MPNEQPDGTPSPTDDFTASPVATVLSSQPLGWSGMTVEQLTYTTTQIEWAPQAEHVLTVHIAEPMSLIQQRDGQIHRGGLVTGDFTLTPAGNPSLWYWDHFLDKLHVRLTPDFVRKVAADCDLNPDRIELLHNFGTHDPQIERLGLALKAELETGGLGGRLLSEALATALTVHLLRHYCTLPQPVPFVAGGLPQPILRRVMDYIQAHLAEDLSLESMATVAAMSAYHFSRLFKQATGLAPHQYLITCRIERAKSLLKQGDLTIAQIARIVGFSSQSHFGYHFKRLTGITPRQFR
ncbi:MAG: helix-turn-helix domain-containing protein [Leptolyngbya sp. BL-A-14]